jgi:hypothetical protein
MFTPVKGIRDKVQTADMISPHQEHKNKKLVPIKDKRIKKQPKVKKTKDTVMTKSKV